MIKIFIFFVHQIYWQFLKLFTKLYDICRMVMRTWHLWIWPLITWWARFNICIVIFGTTHLVPYVYVSIWLKVQLCFKVQAHQSSTFGSAAQQYFFTLGTPAQVEACLKDVENTLEMAQDVLHLVHHLRRSVRGVQANWRPKQHQLQVHFCNTPGVYHHNYKDNLMVNMIVSTKFA